MNDHISQQQIDFYQDNGFIVIEDFLDLGELAQWRETTQEAVDQRLAASAGQGFNQGLSNQDNPDAYYAQVFTQCLKLAETHPGMHELMYDPRLGKMAATLAGVDGIPYLA